MSRDGRRPFILLTLALLPLTASAAAAAPACAAYLKFLGSECAAWQADILPMGLPPARGNRFADRQDAAAFGMKVFYDNRFSKPGSGVACASCHDPEHSFAEKKARSHTLAEAARNAPDLINASWYTTAHFWDGKVDNLWSAPLFTLEQTEEMGATRLQVVHTVASIYKIRYEKIFGPLPDLSDTKRFPESGKPGMPAYDAMAPADKLTVNQIYANLGKVLEAYIRKLAAGRSAFDNFMAGSQTSITPAAQRGMVAFTKYGCQSCHSGPTFTDEKFHKLGLPAVPQRARDTGRESGLRFVRDWQFLSAGRFADPAVTEAVIPDSKPVNQSEAFRTPSLRNVAQTAPYGHDGSLDTLELAISAHAAVLPNHSAPTPADEKDLEEFLRSLAGRPPQAPWNYWPGG